MGDDNGAMDAKDDRSALLAAVTTEHFVMQTAIGAALDEAQSRANMFIGALSGASVAMGCATQSETVFLPNIHSSAAAAGYPPERLDCDSRESDRCGAAAWPRTLGPVDVAVLGRQA
jgi:hypothetical protein